MALSEERRYTYADILDWPEDERVELIYGEPYQMAPGPLFTHQTISFALGLQLGKYLEGKKCRALCAPFDVLLFAQDGDYDEDIDTVVQPDVFVVCDPSKWGERRCNGAPDLIIEILSPSTTKHDRITKFNLYQRAGVREYWLVDPRAKVVQVMMLEDGKYYAPTVYTAQDTVPVGVLDDCQIDLRRVFANV